MRVQQNATRCVRTAMQQVRKAVQFSMGTASEIEQCCFGVKALKLSVPFLVMGAHRRTHRSHPSGMWLTRRTASYDKP